MLAGDETGAPAVDLAQKGTGTEVPVLDPEVVRVHGLQHQPQQGAFLGMAIFTGKDIASPSRARAHRRPRISPARRRPAPRATL